jgi:ryanodine receptor 2
MHSLILYFVLLCFSVVLNNDLNSIVQQFSEHYHDAWASKKMDNSWVYGDQWSDTNKTHPRLKPYSMLNDYVSKTVMDASS